MLDGDLDGAVAAYTEAGPPARGARVTARTCPRSSSGSPRSPPGGATWPGPVSCPRPPGRPWSRTDRPSTGASPRRGGRRSRSRGATSTRRARCRRTRSGTSRSSVPRTRRASTWRPWWRPRARGSPSPTVTCAPPASRPSARTARRSRAQDMPLLAQASGTAAELALALGQPERAAELLGASAVVRGADDPTDPMAVKLAPLLRAALGDDRYERRLRAAGKALGRAEAIERLDPAALTAAGVRRQVRRGCNRAAPAGRTPRAARRSRRTSSRPARRPGRRAAGRAPR